jgi:heterodisulfide reductase subunit B
LILFEQDGLKDVTLPCAACFNRFRGASRDLRLDPELMQDLSQELGYTYQNSVNITSLLELITSRIGLDKVKEQVKRPLKGLKVACYYGCLLTRPPAVTGAENHEYPMSMDHLIEALGGIPVDWDRKVACCGASLSMTNTEIVLKISGEILTNAKARGAHIVAVACPLCHTNLDGRQTQMEAKPILPALYFTQLMALAFDMPKQAALKRNMIDPHPTLEEKGLL